jgi:hypothetical protein
MGPDNNPDKKPKKQGGSDQPSTPVFIVLDAKTGEVQVGGSFGTDGHNITIDTILDGATLTALGVHGPQDLKKLSRHFSADSGPTSTGWTPKYGRNWDNIFKNNGQSDN